MKTNVNFHPYHFDRIVLKSVQLISPLRKLQVQLKLFIIVGISINLLLCQTNECRAQETLFKVYDFNGNEVDIETLRVTEEMPVMRGSTEDCDLSSYFELFFEEGCGMEDPEIEIHQQRRDVLCQLFHDLSEFIIPDNSEQKVRVIFSQNPNASYVAAGSSFYLLPATTNPVGGVLDNVAYTTINSGTDAYTNAIPLEVETYYFGLAHCAVSINFEDNPDLNYNLAVEASEEEQDFYSIVMHEMAHCLAFSGLSNSQPSANFINLLPPSSTQKASRYNTFIATSEGVHLITPVAENQMYEQEWNPILAANNLFPQTVLGLQSNCLNPIRFFSSIEEVEVYMGNYDSQIYHLSENCHPDNLDSDELNNIAVGSYYAMYPVADFGALGTKRWFAPEERLVFCSLGYSVNSSYGDIENAPFTYHDYETGICNFEAQVGGINDGINEENQFLSVPENTILFFNGSFLLGNDNATEFQNLEVIQGDGILTGTLSGDAETTFEYGLSNASISGLHILRYVPVKNGLLGNITYVFINVLDNQCSEDGCNLVKNGGFESWQTCHSLNGIVVNGLNCWLDYSGGSMLWTQDCVNGNAQSLFSLPAYDLDLSPEPINTPTLGLANNQSIIGLQVLLNPLGQLTSEDAVQTYLSESVTAGEIYTLRYKVKTANGTNEYVSNTSSKISACIAPGLMANISPDYSPYADGVDLIGSEYIVVADGEWHAVSQTFEYSGSDGQCLIIGIDSEGMNYDKGHYLWIDDVELIQGDALPLDVSITGTNISCFGVTDGELCVSVSGGTQEYEFLWSNDAETDCISGLAAGTLSCTVTDANGCIASAENSIAEPQELSVTHTSTPTSCPDACDGTATAISEGGTGDVTITWPVDTDIDALCIGTYVAIATDENGCSNTFEVEITETPLDYPTGITYTGEDWNGATVSFGGDLIIPFGMQATFSNVNFIFTSGSNFVIEEGASVDAENMDITSCTSSWKGMQVLGDSDLSLYGSLNWEGGTCRHAITSIELNMMEDIGGQQGPAVKVENVDFTNNQIVFKADHCQQLVAGVSGDIVGPIGFTNCGFLVDDDYYNHFTAMGNQVSLLETTGYGFKSCYFLNQTSSDTWAERGRAIDATSARFDLDDIDEFGNDAGGSIFKGWDFAIHADLIDEEYHYSIWRESSFLQNRVAIFSQNVKWHTIVRNTIAVGDDTGIPNLNEDPVDREGIVIDGGGFFLLSENNITGTPLETPNAVTVGIRVRDILTGSEEVYNNTITDCNYANLANGTNSIADEGVRYICNHHSGNATDLLVSEFPGNGNTANISEWQSDLGSVLFLGFGEQAAGNTFTTAPTEWHIDNEGNQVINYLFGSGTGEEPTDINDPLLVLPQPATSDNSCELLVTEMMPGIGDVDGTTLADWAEKIPLTQGSYNEARYMYKSLIDGGDTDELMELVESAWSTNVWNTRQTLMAQSPYVSAAVLENLAKQCPAFPYSVALEILLANPSPTMTPKFLWMLENETTFPQYMIDMVANNTGQSTFRDEIEEQLAKSHMAFIENKSKMLRYQMRRGNLNTWEKIAHLDSLQTVTAELSIIDLLLAGEDYIAALDRCDSLESKFEYATRVKREQDALYEWIEVMDDNAGDLQSLSISDLAKLRDLAVDYYYTTAGKKASAVLNHYYHEDHFIPPYYGSGSASVRALQNNTTQEEIHLMHVYPNPADELVQVQLVLGSQTLADEHIQIVDAFGRVLETFKVTNAQQQLTIDTRVYSAGSYQAILSKGGKALETISFNVLH